MRGQFRRDGKVVVANAYRIARIPRLLLAALVILASSPSVTYGGNFGSQCAVANGVPTCVSLANNRFHYYYFGSVEAPQRDAINWVSANVYGPTDLDTAQVQQSDTDVRVWDSAYGANGIWGWVDCPSHCAKTGAHPNKTGYRQELRFNLTYPNAFDTLFERRYMACHEFGHTVGLRHNGATASCMYANVATSNVLDSHDISHINAAY